MGSQELKFPKPVKEVDELREDFVREMRCLVSEYGDTGHAAEHFTSCRGVFVNGRCESHHVRKGSHSGTGTKPSPRRTVPLCLEAHREYHRIGHLTFCQKYGLDLEAHLVRINREFDQRHPDRKQRRREARKPSSPEMKFVRVNCPCGRQHDIPPSRITRFGKGLRYQCITTGNWEALRVCG